MNITRLAVLGIALVAGVGAFVLMMNTAPEEDRPVQVVEQSEEKTVRVLVATKTFGRGERLDQEQTQWIEWPEKALSPYFVTEASLAELGDVGGSVVRSLIVEGEPIITEKIVSAGNKGLMSAVLSPGMRAVSMSVGPETSAGGFILPGDFVDVVHSTDNGDGESSSKTILSNVRILAVDAQYIETPELAHIPGANVTLELSPEDAEFFITARSSDGGLSLTLRSLFEPTGELQSERRDKEIEVIRYGRS